MDRCTLVYGLTQEEREFLKCQGMELIEVSNDMLNLRVFEIIDGKKALQEGLEVGFKEKIMIFYGYIQDEIKDRVVSIRNGISEGIFAAVTPNSYFWEFGYLVDHLIEERQWFNELNSRRED